MWLLIVLLIEAFFVGPARAAVDADPPEVRLDLELPDQNAEFTNAAGLTIRIEPGELAILKLRVFSAKAPDSPMDVEDATDLLEIRASDGDAVRIGDWNRAGMGVYETKHRFDESGTFRIIVLPDVANRSAEPAGSTDLVEVVVESPLPIPPDEEGRSSTTIIAATVLALAVAFFVGAATRGRKRVPKEPLSHDTWWNSP